MLNNEARPQSLLMPFQPSKMNLFENMLLNIDACVQSMSKSNRLIIVVMTDASATPARRLDVSK